MSHRTKIRTLVEVSDVESGNYSLVRIRTRDRPGLLTDIVKVLKDISVNVVSAEVLLSVLLAVPKEKQACCPLPFLHSIMVGSWVC